MRLANNEKQRRHRQATSEAMKRMVWRCPECQRGQVPSSAAIVRVCRYCGFEKPSAIAGNRES